jgi:hypothetical protein
MAEENDKNVEEKLPESPEESFEEEQPEEMEISKIGTLSSPEGTIMMFAAVILDLAGLFLLCFGLDDFGIIDIAGILLIGGWMYSRSGIISLPRGAQKRASGWLKKLFRGKWKKYLTPLIGEIIPYLGGIAFCWTLAVYYELTD